VHDPLRPTFERDIQGIEPGVLAERIAATLSEEGAGLPHRRAGQHFQIWLPSGKRKMWSPWLHLDVNEVPDSPSTAAIFGRFTPAPSIWTAVMFSYLTLGVIALGGGLFGYSQWLVGEAPWALWLMPACALLAIITLLASRTGQALAREQMGEISSVVERGIPAPTPDPR